MGPVEVGWSVIIILLMPQLILLAAALPLQLILKEILARLAN